MQTTETFSVLNFLEYLKFDNVWCFIFEADDEVNLEKYLHYLLK